jgi:hypothetical protein
VKKARGERVGQIPFGWKLSTDGRTLERGRHRAIGADFDASAAREWCYAA